ncbi:hypothetical protein DL93DRAFT_857245 [Clavulina sp. PMI_390]|nr:hypothetical protein DL93DRAFT_857245 [Clavulina sp. PMI_390]
MVVEPWYCSHLQVILLEKRSALDDRGLSSFTDRTDTLLRGLRVEMGFNQVEWKQLLCHERGTKRESPMNGKGSRGTHRVSLASHHIREPSSRGRGYQRTVAILLNAAITGLTSKYPEGGECGPHG